MGLEFGQLFTWLNECWEQGSKLVRTALIFFFLFPLIVALLALTGTMWVVLSACIVAIFVVILTLHSSINPQISPVLVAGAVILPDDAKNIFQGIVFAIGAELVFGLVLGILCVIDIHIGFGGTLLYLLVFYILIFLGMSRKGDHQKTAGFMIAMVIITLIIFTGVYITKEYFPEILQRKSTATVNAETQTAIGDVTNMQEHVISFQKGVPKRILLPPLESSRFVPTYTIEMMVKDYNGSWLSYEIDSDGKIYRMNNGTRILAVDENGRNAIGTLAEPAVTIIPKEDCEVHVFTWRKS